jgi:hypothetical protein
VEFFTICGVQLSLQLNPRDSGVCLLKLMLREACSVATTYGQIQVSSHYSTNNLFCVRVDVRLNCEKTKNAYLEGQKSYCINRIGRGAQNQCALNQYAYNIGLSSCIGSIGFSPTKLQQ